MDQRFQDAVDAGLGDVSLLEDIFERERGIVLLEQLDDVERFGENGNQVQPLDSCFGQTVLLPRRRFNWRNAAHKNSLFQA